MAISQEQQKRGLEHLKQIRRKYFSESSEAAEWWDNLTPEWRGVVLHAAAVTSGMSHLKTDWLCVATEGDTVDGRVMERQWIIDMGETYDVTNYAALNWCGWMWGIPICFCAGLRGMWSDRSPLKTVFSACSFVSW